MNQKEKATNFETISHIQAVQGNIFKVITALLERARTHDQSKLRSPELEYFTEATEKLHGLTYGSAEYQQNLDSIAPALAHHYANNRHHPQHFENGINDMTLIDLIEMLCDWKASAERQNDGNVRFGMGKNIDRFKIDQQLGDVLKNTIDLFE